jgi:type IV pilus assembly protein PilP
MGTFFIVSRNRGVALGLIALLWAVGCGEPPQQPPSQQQVVSQKVVVPEAEAPEAPKPGPEEAAPLPPSEAPPEEAAPGGPSPAVKEGEEKGAVLSYLPEGKIDPFSPLFRSKPAAEPEEEKAPAEAAAPKQVREKRVPRTPLEKVDLSQLKLVAIITAESGNRALVEDGTGKGYVLRPGTYIGINGGIVKRIQPDRVIVEEEAEDLYGNVSLREREMVLQKPLGEI